MMILMFLICCCSGQRIKNTISINEVGRGSVEGERPESFLLCERRAPL